MLRLYLAILICAINGFSFRSNAQTIENLGAKDFFEYEDYNRALFEYLKLYKQNKYDLHVNLRIGICYLKVNDDKTKAIPYLEFVQKSGEFNDELFLYLGMAYMYAYRLDDAIKFFNTYRSKLKSKNYNLIDRYIENCESAKVLMKKPVNVTFENLGKPINTKYPEYYPFVTQDQSTMYLTSSRDGNARKIQSSEGFFTADIYVSKVKHGEWSKVKSIGNAVNTVEDEQCVYVTPDGQNMIVYIDNETENGDIYITSLGPKIKIFPKPEPFKNPVNTNSLELEGCISEDGNTLIVSSNRAGGMGETDLYKFNKLPNGEWGLPINLGTNVNTRYKEAFPVFDETNQILYFASTGHTSMGGFDIFKSKYDVETQTFGKAINIGYPINTPEDNMGFSLTENKRDGYIAAVRKEGLGDLDIYKVIFNDVDDRLSIIKGVVSINDTARSEMDAFITLIDAQTKGEIDSKNVNPTSGKYIFAVGPGKYILTVVSPGFEDIKEEIIVYDKADYIFEIEKNLLLQKPGAVIPTPKKPLAPLPLKGK